MTVEERINRLELALAVLLQGVDVHRKETEGIGLTEEQIEFLRDFLKDVKEEHDV